MDRIRNLLSHLREQLWLVPVALTVAAMLVAVVMLTFGSRIFNGDGGVWWLYGGGPESARTLLSSLLSGLMTMTSLVISVTFVILTLAASQLGPRLISMFVGDRQIQAVLGLFIGTIVYIIAILRSVDENLGGEGMPHAAVTLASLLTLICLFALLFYIHKIAHAIIADNVVEAVSQGLRKDVKEILHSGSGPDSSITEPPDFDQDSTALRSISLEQQGYIQVVNYSHLVEIACENDAVIVVNVRAGHHLIRHGDHVRLSPGIPAGCDKAIRKAFVIGRNRTAAQDLEHGIRQLVEIAVRALSPGINDPFTAIAVIDRLTAALEEILTGRLQPKLITDAQGRVRVIADRSEIAGVVNMAFDEIRQAGSDNPAILIRIADSLGALAGLLQPGEALRAVLGQLAKLHESAKIGRLVSMDRDDVLARIDVARGIGRARV
ncbi:DUF2254 domain-containing protein [Saliniramus sp.]|uniref:DUF2254 domain-containing protein n=1 Tax=Saliniramus sp. TaxID=2986772 RepID=UPI002BE76761|nr:DUF2254 domain-containing protein [Saliniramus sp.]HMB09347.1 DUF2254 domain-containing protein [Saliniramus sp.]